MLAGHVTDDSTYPDPRNPSLIEWKPNKKVGCWVN
jgi:hypothetical protein